MNEIKALAEKAGVLVSNLRLMTAANAQIAEDGKLLSPILDQRWVSIGQTDLQTGFMALTRAVAQPTTF